MANQLAPLTPPEAFALFAFAQAIVLWGPTAKPPKRAVHLPDPRWSKPQRRAHYATGGGKVRGKSVAEERAARTSRQLFAPLGEVVDSARMAKLDREAGR